MDRQKGDALHLFVVLAKAAQWVCAHANRDMRRTGLNPTEFAVLELLYHKGPQPLQQIGGKILMTSGNITYVIDKLEQKGLVRRRPCPEDRRVSYAEITEQGSAKIGDVFPGHREAIERAVAGLTPDEREQAIALLKKLGKAAQDSY
jgi:MarR family 2-MHQ and catechol resistance regulon transcriptional repressor